MAKQSHDNLETLSELLEEIGFRTSFSATALQVKLTKRVRELESHANRRTKAQERKAEEPGPKRRETTNSDPNELDKLREQLSQAREKIATLQAQINSDNNNAEEKLYRRVGLNKSCPNFVLLAARKEYRKALHPDMHPEARKEEAHKRFTDAEDTFDKIFKIRNL